MATIPPTATEFLLATYDAIALLNSSLKTYKKRSLGSPNEFLNNSREVGQNHREVSCPNLIHYSANNPITANYSG